MPRTISVPSPAPFSRRRFLGATGGLSLSAALAAACGSSGGGGNSTASATALSQAEIDKAMTTPTTLTFWTWVPDIANEVALFEKKYPAIKVDVVNAGQSQPQYTKLRTALPGEQRRPGRVPDRVRVHTVVHDHEQPARPAAVRRVRTQGRLRGLDVGPGQRSERRSLGDSAGHRPDGHALPRGHLRRARDRRTYDVGRVRRRGPHTARGRSHRLPDEPLAERRRRLARPALAGERKALRCLRRRDHGRDQRGRRGFEEGHGVLGSAGAAGRDQHRPGLHRRLVHRLQQGQVRDLGSRPRGDRCSCRVRLRPPPASGARPRCRSGTRPRPCPGTGAARPPP